MASAGHEDSTGARALDFCVVNTDVWRDLNQAGISRRGRLVYMSLLLLTGFQIPQPLRLDPPWLATEIQVPLAFLEAALVELEMASFILRRDGHVLVRNGDVLSFDPDEDDGEAEGQE
jgi:hypothetical protein